MTKKHPLKKQNQIKIRNQKIKINQENHL